MRLLVVVLLVTACGRLSFDPQTGDAGAVDAPDIVHPAKARVLFVGVVGSQTQTTFDALFATLTQSDRTLSFSTTVDAAELADVDLVFVQSLQRAYAPAEATALASAVASGTGLVVLNGFGGPTEQADTASLLDDLAISFPTISTIDGPILPTNAHPVMQGITELPWRGGNSCTTTLSGAVTLGSLSGQPAAFAATHGFGRIVCWGDDWIMFDGMWTPDVQRFWENTFAWVWPTS